MPLVTTIVSFLIASLLLLAMFARRRARKLYGEAWTSLLAAAKRGDFAIEEVRKVIKNYPLIIAYKRNPSRFNPDAVEQVFELLSEELLIKAELWEDICAWARLLQARYSQKKIHGDLTKAIGHFRAAAAVSRDAEYYMELGGALLQLYRDEGGEPNVKEAISLFSRLTEGSRHGSAVSTKAWWYLGLCHFNRFARSEQIADADEALDAFHRAIALAKANRDNRSFSIAQSLLGKTLRYRYAKSHDIADLTARATASELASDANPKGSSAYDCYAEELVDALSDRFYYGGDLADLERAVSIYESIEKPREEGNE